MRFTEVDDFHIIEGFYDTESGLGFRLWRAGRVAIRSTSSTVGTVTPSMTSSGRPGERIPSFTDLFSVVTCSECIDIMGGTVEGRCPECLADRHETCTGRAEVREIVYGEWVISDLGGSQPCWCLDDQCQRARVDRIRRRNKRD